MADGRPIKQVKFQKPQKAHPMMGVLSAGFIIRTGTFISGRNVIKLDKK